MIIVPIFYKKGFPLNVIIKIILLIEENIQSVTKIKIKYQSGFFSCNWKL